MLYRDDSMDDGMANKTNNSNSKSALHIEMEKSHHSASQYFNSASVEENVADALLPLFVRIQKLLRKSSMDPDIKHMTDRFDERVSSDAFPLRDEYDRKVSACAQQMKNVLSHMLSERVVQTKLPFSQKNAV